MIGVVLRRLVLFDKLATLAAVGLFILFWLINLDILSEFVGFSDDELLLRGVVVVVVALVLMLLLKESILPLLDN